MRQLSDLSIIGTFSIATQSNNNLFYLNKNGDIGLSTTSQTARFHVKSAGTQSNYSIKIDSLNNSPLLYVRDDANIGVATNSVDYTKFFIDQAFVGTTSERIKGQSIHISATSSTRNRTGLEISLGPRDIINGGVDDITNSYKQSAIFAYVNTFEAGFKGQSVALFEGKLNLEPNFENINKTGVDITISGSGVVTGYNATLNASSVEDDAYSLTGFTTYISGTTSAPHLGYFVQLDGSVNDPESKKYGFRSSITGSASQNYGIYIDTNSSYGNNYGVFVLNGSSIFNYDQSAFTDFTIRGTNDENLFFVDASSNFIGINNDLPDAKLHLISSGYQSDFSVKIDNSIGNPLLYVRDDSNVGIGTSSLNYTRLYVRQSSTVSTTWGVRSDVTGNAILSGETLQGTVYAYSASASNGSTNIGYYATIKDSRTSNKVTANYGSYHIISGTAQNNYGAYSLVSEAQDNNYGFNSIITGTYGSVHTNFNAYNSSNMNGLKYGLNVQLSGSSNISTGVLVSISGGTENYSIRTGYGVSEFNYLNDSNADFKIRGSVENNLFFVDASANYIGVSTQNPSYSLHVLGTVSSTNLRMTNGASSSYVMVSDSTGNASWQKPKMTFTLQTLNGTFTPIANTTYYAFSTNSPSTTAANQAVNIGMTFSIERILLLITTTSNTPTNESHDLYIRNVTQATSNFVGTFSVNGSSGTVAIDFKYGNLNINIGNNDEFSVEYRTPTTYGTAPTGTAWRSTLFCREV